MKARDAGDVVHASARERNASGVAGWSGWCLLDRAKRAGHGCSIAVSYRDRPC
jgi:hypothetical protein